MLTLWSIFRSPLLFGGNLTKLDDWTTSLLTNKEVLQVDQHSSGNHPVLIRPDVIVWSAKPEDGRGTILAAFNPTDTTLQMELPWRDLQMAGDEMRMRDLWLQQDLPGSQRSLTLHLQPHASVLLRVQSAR